MLAISLSIVRYELMINVIHFINIGCFRSTQRVFEPSMAGVRVVGLNITPSLMHRTCVYVWYSAELSVHCMQPLHANDVERDYYRFRICYFHSLARLLSTQIITISVLFAFTYTCLLPASVISSYN